MLDKKPDMNDLGKRRVMKINDERGFTLLEIIIAISILTIGLLAVATMQITAIRGNNFAYIRTEGSTLAQDKMEELIALPFDDLDGSGTTETGPYKVDYSVTNGAISKTKKIEVTTKYRNDQINQMEYLRSELK